MMVPTVTDRRYIRWIAPSRRDFSFSLILEDFRQEALGGFGRGGGEEIFCGRLFEDLAVGQKGDLVGYGAGEIHGVGDKDEGAAFRF